MKVYHTIIAILLATSFSTCAMAANVINIAITGPFSGGSASMGISMRDGAKLAIAQINQKGGINVGGKMMKIEIIEDESIARAKPFIQAYHRAYGVTRIPSPVSAAQGYDTVLLLAEAIHEAGSTNPSRIKVSLENLKMTVRGCIADWRKPGSKWEPSNVATHEAFRLENTVMGKVQNGHVVLANPADKIVLQGKTLK